MWARALAQASLPADLKPHSLRHTCASLLIAKGCTVKQVQKHLGHSNPSITLNTYTHLFESDDDVWADSESLASPQQVPEVIDLNAKRAFDQDF